MKRFSWHLLHVLFDRPPAGAGEPVPDSDLLERYAQGDPASFELLVFRHADAVFGTCARVCRDVHDAEDAFQATFLVLARKANSVRRASCLAGWLHRVAHRAATRAAVRRAKTLQREQLIVVDPPAKSMTNDSTDLQEVLDVEINRLTDRYRLPVLLCYLHGLSTDVAAKQLGIPRGTVLSRLATARLKLTARLTRRGVTLSATAAGFLGLGTGQTVSAGLVTDAARAVALPLTSPTASLLAREIIHMTAWKTTTAWALVLVAIGGLGGGVWALATGAEGQPAAAKKEIPEMPLKAEEKQEEEPKRLNTAQAARERFLQVEKVARLPADKQVKELPPLYRDLAPGLMSPFIEGILSSYPSDILNRNGKFENPGGDLHAERWANQIAAAAATLTPDQVADKLDGRMWSDIGARTRLIQIMKKNLEALNPLLRDDLKSSNPDRVSRAASVIATLRIDSFLDLLLAIYLRNDDCSKSVHDSMLLSPSLFCSDLRVAKALMAEVAKNPAAIQRHGGLLAGIFQGKPADPLIVKMLLDPAPETRRAAAWVLAQAKDDSLAPHVATLVKDSDFQTRIAATWIAERLSDEAFRPISASVRTLLESPDIEVRLRACKCLAAHRDMSVAKTLLEFLRQAKVESGEAVEIFQSLQKLTGSTFGYDMHEWGPAQKGNQEAIRKFEEWIRLHRAKAMGPTTDSEAVAWSNWLKVNIWSWLEKDAPADTKPWEELFKEARDANRSDTKTSQLEYLRQLQRALNAKTPRAGELRIREAIGDAMVLNFSHRMPEEAISWYAQILDRFMDLPTCTGTMLVNIRLAELLSGHHDREAYRSIIVRLLLEVLDTPDAAILVIDDNKFLTLDQTRKAKYPAAERKRMADSGAPPDNVDALDVEYGKRLVEDRAQRIVGLREAAASTLAQAQYVDDDWARTRANLLKLQKSRSDDKLLQTAVAAYLRKLDEGKK